MNIHHFCVYLQCVGDDIEDLEYTPKPEFEGFFKVTNVQNEVMICMHTQPHLPVFVYTRMCIYKCMYLCIFAYIYVCRHAYMWLHECFCVCACLCACFVHIHVHIYKDNFW
jgi:hypothetical protein